MDADVLSLSDLGQRSELGKGGQAIVYAITLRLPDCPGQLVYKEYRSGQAPNSGLESIAGFRRKLSPTDRALLDRIAAWPAKVVKDGTITKGIVMPRIPDRFFLERTMKGDDRSKPREAQFLFLSPAKCRRLSVPLVNLFQRYAVCRELAGALKVLHDRGIMFGDLNSKNEIYHVIPGTDDAEVMLVDCDAVRKRGSGAVVAQLNSPDWDPPPSETNLTMETDIYKLGLFVYRALTPGTNASATVDVNRVSTLLDASGMDLLRRSLDRDRSQRPEAGDWQAYFASRPRGPSSTPPPKPSRDPVLVKALQPAPQTPGGWVKKDGEWVRRPPG